MSCFLFIDQMLQVRHINLIKGQIRLEHHTERYLSDHLIIRGKVFF